MYETRSDFHHLLTNTLKKTQFRKFLTVLQYVVIFSSSKSKNDVKDKEKVDTFSRNYSDFVECCNRVYWYL